MKPITFSTSDVQAIITGKKTQTRWAIKKLPHCPVHGIDPYFTSGVLLCKGCDHFPIAPKYKPGDILWVRETWRSTGVTSKPYAYRADEEDMVLIGETGNWLNLRYRYKPSIHMPREAARIFLRVTNVRAERLQDISHLDCLSEGIRTLDDETAKRLRELDVAVRQGRAAPGSAATAGHLAVTNLYHILWDNLNAKRGYGWNSNPWVWAYTFEQCNEKGAKTCE